MAALRGVASMSEGSRQAASARDGNQHLRAHEREFLRPCDHRIPARTNHGVYIVRVAVNPLA